MLLLKKSIKITSSVSKVSVTTFRGVKNDETTAYTCYHWTPEDESQIQSSSDKEVCESLGHIFTEGLFSKSLLFENCTLGVGAFLCLALPIWDFLRPKWKEWIVSKCLRKLQSCPWLWLPLLSALRCPQNLMLFFKLNLINPRLIGLNRVETFEGGCEITVVTEDTKI